MKQCLLVFLVMCCSVLTSSEQHENNLHLKKKTKRKINEDDWVWSTTEGFSDKILPKLRNAETSTVTPSQVSNPPDAAKNLSSSDLYYLSQQKVYDECVANITTRVIPDFRIPGRSFGIVRCMENRWYANGKVTRQNLILDCDRKAFSRYFYLGGRGTYLGEFPHMAAIGWKTWLDTWAFKCGGTLISNKFVLTAAHCSQASPTDTELADPVPKIVRIGIKNLGPLTEGFSGATYPNEEGRKNTSFMENPVAIFALTEGTDVEIKQFITHPDYRAPEKYNDIAIIELATPIKYSTTLFPACLWLEPSLDKLGDIFVGTGWGVVRESDTKISPELQAADLDLIDSPKCDELLSNHCSRNWCGLKESQLCAGKLAGGVDSCQGDSGGPLQKKLPDSPYPYHMYYVIGVTSFGIGCGQKNLPGVFTRVSSYNDWIEDIVWPKNTRDYVPYKI